MEKTPPLILITNDDGIGSPGLQGAAEAAYPLGELLIVAPDRQRSGAGRSMPHDLKGTITPRRMEVNEQSITAYQVDASPALAVLHALLELAPRRPSLLISGINYGENVGADITISGTIGAALEGAVNGLSTLAVSLQTPKETHTETFVLGHSAEPSVHEHRTVRHCPDSVQEHRSSTAPENQGPSDEVDFTAAVHFTRLFARRLLATSLPFDVDVLKVDVPSGATPETAWQLTRVSRHTYFTPVPPQRDSLAVPGQIDYEPLAHPEQTEPDSDIYALAVERIVSVAPLSLDLTSRVNRDELRILLQDETRR